MKMKLTYILCFLTIMVFSIGCSSSKTATSDKQTVKNSVAYQNSKNGSENRDNSISLQDHIRRLSGVQVSGEGSNAIVRVRGMVSSINADSSPLFIVDGQQVGKSFAIVHNTLNINDIKRVRVLKDISGLSMYGFNGSNGVIVITTKTGRK